MTIPEDIHAAARATDDLYRALTAMRRQYARELSAHPDLALRAANQDADIVAIGAELLRRAHPQRYRRPQTSGILPATGSPCVPPGVREEPA